MNFEEIRFEKGEISFAEADFGEGEIFFDFADFGESIVDFSRAKADRVRFSWQTLKTHMDLRFLSVNSLLIENCILEKTVKISGNPNYLFFNTTINLGQISFEDEPKKIIRALKKHIEGNRKEKNKWSKLTKEQILKTITLVKENYHALGEYDGEDRAYRLYMKYKTNTWYGWPLKFFNLVGGYGTKPLRIIIAMFITMFGFAGAYFAFFMNQFKDTLSTFWDTLYYSGITFLTIGYGDISPAFERSMGLRFVSVAEGFIGLFLMSYLTVAVVRKLLR